MSESFVTWGWEVAYYYFLKATSLSAYYMLSDIKEMKILYIMQTN